MSFTSIIVDVPLLKDSASPTPPTPPPRRGRGRPRKDGITKQPKPKPPNPFILYSLDHRERVSQENKDVSNAEISRLLGVAWKKLHPDEKKKYKAKAASVKDSFTEDPNYVFTPPKKTDAAMEHLNTLFHELKEANILLNSLAQPIDSQPQQLIDSQDSPQQLIDSQPHQPIDSQEELALITT